MSGDLSLSSVHRSVECPWKAWLRVRRRICNEGEKINLGFLCVEGGVIQCMQVHRKMGFINFRTVGDLIKSPTLDGALEEKKAA